MQLVLDGGAADPDIEKFSLELQDTSTKGKTVTVQSLVTIRQKGKKEYATEYTLTQTETGNALDASFGKAKSQEQIALSMPLNSSVFILIRAWVLARRSAIRCRRTHSPTVM